MIVTTHKSRNKTIKKKTVEKPSRHLRPWNPRSLTQSCALHPNTWAVVSVRATHRCSAGFRRRHFFQRAPVLTWTKHILMGVSLFEHEDAVNHGLALGRHLPCPCTAPITSSYQLYCNSSRHGVFCFVAGRPQWCTKPCDWPNDYGIVVFFAERIYNCLYLPLVARTCCGTL